MRKILIIIYSMLTLSVSGQGVKIGDFIKNDDGSEGIVFWLSPDATYGWMVAIEARKLPAAFPAGLSGLSGKGKRSEALLDTAGYGNTALLLEELKGKTEFASLREDFRNGWYIPSLGQLRKLLSLGCQLPLELTSDVYLSSTWGGDNLFWVTTRWGETKTQGPSIVYFPVRMFSLVEYDMTLSYRWNTGAVTPGITERPSGTTLYEVTATTSAGCYAKAEQAVFVASAAPEIIDAAICRGEVYRQYGIEASESGEYPGTLSNTSGCEQEILVRLKVNEPEETVIEASIREGEVYRENGFTEWEAGEHRQVWQRANGCDSTVILQLTVLPAPRSDIYDTICEGNIYTGNGFSASVAGDYERFLKSAEGLDSLVVLHLTVTPGSRVSLPPVSVCAGESYAFFGKTLTETGMYRHTLTNHRGCDSIVELNLTVRSLNDTLIRDTVCAGAAYRKHGFDLAEVTEGQQIEPLHLPSCWGCDSVVRLELQVNSGSRTLLPPAYICAGESYAFFGKTLTDAGTYYHTLPDQWGCDSILELNLAVRSLNDTLIRDTVCAGAAYRKHGFDLTAVTEGQPIEPLHLPDRWGCDSVVRLELQVNPVSRRLLEPEYICEGGSYVFFGETLTETGTYYHTLPDHRGCDSILELSLTVRSLSDTLVRDTVCDGAAYRGHGFVLDTVTEGQEIEPLHLPDRWGCDSVVRLELQVNPVSRRLLEPEYICEGGSYAFFGKTLTETGTYRYTLTNQWGCDSILELNLTVGLASRDTIHAAICFGERYQADGFDEAETGFYRREYPDVHGCDSFVYLDLKVRDYFAGGLQMNLTDCALHEYAFEADWEEQMPVEGSRYVWDFGDGESQETEEPSVRYAYADTGTYPVQLEVIAPGDCVQEREASVHIPYYEPELSVYCRPEYLDFAHPEVRLWTDSVAGMRYTWDLGDGNRGYGWSVEHTYVFQGQDAYRIVLESVNEEDCPARKEFVLSVRNFVNPQDNFIVPNTITPNGDGVNDYFMRGYRVRIFNRNGVVVFQGEDGWDGLRDGQPVPEDTYFYEVYYLASEGERSKRGYVTVVR